MRTEVTRDLSRERVKVAHLVPHWLPLSQNWLHAQVIASLGGDSVFAGQSDADALQHFPVSSLVELAPREVSLLARAARRGVSIVSGAGSTTSRRFRDQMRATRYDLVHGHHGESGVNALAAARDQGLPVVTSFYGRDQVPQPGYPELFAEGDLFFALGPEMARTLISVGAPEPRVRVVPLSLDLNPFNFKDRGQNRSTVIVAIGRLVEKKGFSDAIQAFSQVAPEWRGSELWIVGDGPLRESLESEAAASSAPDRVRFCGAVTRAHLPELLDQVSYAIQPSHVASDGDKEGSPTTVLELQAVGIPVVATRHADIPFTVPDPARLVAERDIDGLATELLRMAALSDSSYSELARAGRDLVERQHEAGRVAEVIADHYDEVLAASSQRR